MSTPAARVQASRGTVVRSSCLPCMVYIVPISRRTEYFLGAGGFGNHAWGWGLLAGGPQQTAELPVDPYMLTVPAVADVSHKGAHAPAQAQMRGHVPPAACLLCHSGGPAAALQLGCMLHGPFWLLLSVWRPHLSRDEAP